MFLRILLFQVLLQKSNVRGIHGNLENIWNPPQIGTETGVGLEIRVAMKQSPMCMQNNSFIISNFDGKEHNDIINQYRNDDKSYYTQNR